MPCGDRNKQIPKVIRKGMVAVLYSPGYGAGWYSWNTEYPECLFDPEIVSMIEGGQREAVAVFADLKYGEGFYSGGADNLRIEWVRIGVRFEIAEQDGNERVRTFSPNDGIVA